MQTHPELELDALPENVLGFNNGNAATTLGAAGAVARISASSPVGVAPANPTSVASGKKLLSAASVLTAPGGGKIALVVAPAKISALGRPTEGSGETEEAS